MAKEQPKSPPLKEGFTKGNTKPESPPVRQAPPPPPPKKKD